MSKYKGLLDGSSQSLDRATALTEFLTESNGLVIYQGHSTLVFIHTQLNLRALNLFPYLIPEYNESRKANKEIKYKTIL